MSPETTQFDATVYIKTPERQAEYLLAALEDGDPSVIALVLGDIARARGASAFAKETGLSRKPYTRRSLPAGTRHLKHCEDMALTCVVGRILLGLALVSMAFGFAAFDFFSIPSEAEVRRASAAVVFTGAFERVDAGLQLVHSGVVPLLYVSGLNANAGILPASFVSQFSVRNSNIADLRRLVECCVEWGELADNTFQNAQDTKCWADRRGLTGPLLLITSRWHMARAMAALWARSPAARSFRIPPMTRSRRPAACEGGRSNISNILERLSPIACRRWSTRGGERDRSRNTAPPSSTVPGRRKRRWRRSGSREA